MTFLLVALALLIPASRAAEPLETLAGPQGFKARPRCPQGTHPAAPSDGLKNPRCVRAPAGETDPPPSPAPEEAYRRYSVPSEMSFEYPIRLQPRDGWKDAVPTLSFVLEEAAPGKPVMIMLTKVERSQPSFITIAAAAKKDKDWQGARDGGAMAVAGVKARITVVPGESKTVYVPISADAYYAVVYSAPAESYDLYHAAFDRLLKTMRLARSGK